jgi:hypothetical protein
MINNTINNNTLRLTSIYDTTGEKGTITYKVYAPYTDNYTITISTKFDLKIFDNSLNLLNNNNLSLNKNDIIYLNISGSINTFFKLTVELKNNYIELPYEINSNINIANLSTYSSNDLNPLKPSPVSYIKRQDENNRGLYVNCNNPEKLSKNEMNTSLIKQDVTNKDVFFTFEHNNHNENFYYGYRVTNTGDDDVFVTVKNLGYHFAGAGSWLGEDEWIKFYNIDFESSTEGWTQSQIENYIAYVGFCNTYKSENRKPITYRIPKGKYIFNRMQHSTSELVTVKEIFSLCPTERRPNSANHFGDLPFRGGLCGLRSHTRANNVDRASNYSMF